MWFFPCFLTEILQGMAPILLSNSLCGNSQTRNDEETRIKEPEVIIERMTVKRGNKVVTKVLVKWKHLLPEDATWEFFFDLKKKFPNFNP